MQAFHNDPAIKAKYLARIAEHRRLDQIIQGVGFQDGRGCAIGCTLDDYDPSRFPKELGISIEVANLEDVIFERLPAKTSLDWPGRVLAAIPVGADLSGVWPEVAIWVLTDPGHGARQYAAGFPDIEKAIDDVVSLYRERLPSNNPRWSASRAAEGAAEAARWAAAGWTAEAAVTYASRAAMAAAEAAAGAAEGAAGAGWAEAAAAWAARAAQAAAEAAMAAEAAARQAFWLALSDKFIELLGSPPDPWEG